MKPIVKRWSLSLGVYRGARLVSDTLTNRAALGRINDDTEFYKKLLPTGSLCFDVGANIGEKTEALLRAGMRVVAFEPQPECIKEIEARCRAFGGSLIICKSAVGSKIGEANLHLSNYHATASLHQGWENGNDDSIVVPMTTLNKAINKFGMPFFLKVDVEGWEYEVLKGTEQVIPIISFEYHLTEREIDTAVKCLRHLEQISGDGIEVNITPAEKLKFMFSDWLSVNDFLSRFPEAFSGDKDFLYGDIWVRSESK